jgi:hypothetical protein
MDFSVAGGCHAEHSALGQAIKVVGDFITGFDRRWRTPFDLQGFASILLSMKVETISAGDESTTAHIWESALMAGSP